MNGFMAFYRIYIYYYYYFLDKLLVSNYVLSRNDDHQPWNTCVFFLCIRHHNGQLHLEQPDFETLPRLPGAAASALSSSNKNQ